MCENDSQCCEHEFGKARGQLGPRADGLAMETSRGSHFAGRQEELDHREVLGSDVVIEIHVVECGHLRCTASGGQHYFANVISHTPNPIPCSAQRGS